MAQTTAASSRSNFLVEVSTDASTWVDISGQSAGVTISGGEQHIGEQNTADGSAPVVTGSNKVTARSLEVNALYTETSGEAWKVVVARYDGAAKTIAVRYSPEGGNTGDERFTTANDAGTTTLVPIENVMIPDGDASTGDPLMFTFTVKTPKLVAETIS